MVKMNNHKKINYLEFPATDIEATKTFFTDVFAWSFVDYGPDYVAFSDAGIEGGFAKSDIAATTANGSVLVVLYSKQLKQTQSDIETAGGLIIKPIYSFPGGYRFHFTDPNGNEFSVWSELDQ
jgi:hypothetical protein